MGSRGGTGGQGSRENDGWSIQKWMRVEGGAEHAGDINRWREEKWKNQGVKLDRGGHCWCTASLFARGVRKRDPHVGARGGENARGRTGRMPAILNIVRHG